MTNSWLTFLWTPVDSTWAMDAQGSGTTGGPHVTPTAEGLLNFLQTLIFVVSGEALGGGTMVPPEGFVVCFVFACTKT